MHSECGLTFFDVARYTPQELTRLQLGWLLRENPGGGSRSGSHSKQKQQIRQGQRKARQEMLDDIGVH